MKKLAATASLAFALALVSGTAAEARPHPAGHNKSFVANKKFGLGLEIFDIFGLTGKYFISENSAIDFGFGEFGYYGWHDRYRGAGGLHMYGDWLYHPLSFTSNESFDAPVAS